MNRLKKILLSFVLPILCLLISVSYAEIEMDIPYYAYGFSWSSTAPTSPFSDYTFDEIYNISNSYTTNPTDETTNAFNNMCSYIDNAGYCIEWVKWDYRNGMYGPWFETIIFKKGDGELGIKKESDRYQFLFRPNSTQFELYLACSNPNTTKFTSYTSLTDSELNDYKYILSTYFSNFSNDIEIEYCNTNIKNMTYTDSRYYWDGTYFYEYSGGGSEETPTMPTNAEIAQVVQAFYNSDYYKNNKDFSDFMVLYNYDTNYFDFVGHNFGIDLGQVIVPPDYEYEGYSYNQDWWKFFLRNISSEIASKLWNRYYWLYSTNDFGENITYEGKGSIKNLIDLHFSTKSIIVYSTTDYPVVKIETDENGVFNPVEGTIPGDQYTYDENLDPTTNEYNPVENFVPSNPVQSVLGDVDFDEINKTFEENKDILNIEGASWLFTANNKLVGYFIGFLSLLIVFLIISRVLGG